ncbi:DUF3068 domain-containing protein [Allonocardiopsis opalescens]|uniref:DUF3068 family protein n=1 Tax=Allonocardiopsis opalescens TaxID=1144618 RepID=A0A2T0QCB7_9ACTN|nr:DUF3068 domain-containing protein [Allonocardiopsis opalescens]PRY01594.1 Protein of unknown function (DUF3068) [Allonocardiopsis opalescens]
MRRTTGTVLIGLGAFLLVTAPALHFIVAPSLMRAPADYYTHSVLRAENVTYFNIEDMEQYEGVTVEANATARGDVEASTDAAAQEGGYVVWDQFTWVTDIEREFAISSNSRRTAHDAVTAEAVDCCDAAIDEDTSVVQTGLAFKFPFFAEQRDYEFYDTRIQEARPIEFVGVEEIDGIEVYRYEQRIEPTEIEERVLPAELLGVEPDEEGGTDVTADMMYSIVRTYWIDPVTGTPLDQSEDQYQALAVDGEERMTVFDGNLRFTEDTIQDRIAASERGRTMLPLLRTTLPVAFLVAGPVLIAIGLVLSFGRRPAHRG